MISWRYIRHRGGILARAASEVAALVDSGPTGVWAESLITAGDLAAPHLFVAEAANLLRRLARSGEISGEIASSAHRDLLDLPIELFAYDPFAERIWALRDNVTVYDAWYIAVAESLGAPLATLDLKLSRAPGPRCAFTTPPR